MNSFFIDTGLYLNIIAPDLETFYATKAEDGTDPGPLLAGIVAQELRTVSVCGSFQQSLECIRDVISHL